MWDVIHNVLVIFELLCWSITRTMWIYLFIYLCFLLCWLWVTFYLLGQSYLLQNNNVDGKNVSRAFHQNTSKQIMDELFPIWSPIFFSFNWIGPNAVKNETAWASSIQYCLDQQSKVLTSPCWQPGWTHAASGCCQLGLLTTSPSGLLTWCEETRPPPQVAADFIEFLLSQSHFV